MTDDPYRPPNSDLKGNNSKPPSQNTAWRVYFGFNSLLIILNFLSVPFLKSIGLIEIIDFTFANISFVGLCGFMFSKPIGKVIFWRYFFYAASLEALFVFTLYPLFGWEIFDQVLTIDAWYLFSVVNTFFMLVALNLYAYKAKAIWR
jgi:hypothetical protein